MGWENAPGDGGEGEGERGEGEDGGGAVSSTELVGIKNKNQLMMVITVSRGVRMPQAIE